MDILYIPIYLSLTHLIFNIYIILITHSQLMQRKFLILSLFLLTVYSQTTPQLCNQLSFLPMPDKIQCNITNLTKYPIQNPCGILFKLENIEKNEDYAHIQQLIEHQQKKTFWCHNFYVMTNEMSEFITKGFNYQVRIRITDRKLRSVFTNTEQFYSLKIQQNRSIITTETYVGFVRALETFMQSITCNKFRPTNCYMSHLPIIIQDKPEFVYRSVMVDTSRHYQPIRILYETVDALMYNKMNVMHWHIVDQDSFPLKLKSHPQLAQYGAFSPEEVYTPEEIIHLVRYAMVRGVRIVPELDTPGHAASWAKAPQNKKVGCTFSESGYMGPLDVSLDETYKLIKQVFTELFQIFPDPYVHLGGDEVALTCLKNKTDFMKAYGINQGQIELQYRILQKKMLKQVNETKRFLYWMNGDVQIQKDDIIHWWGGSLPRTENQIIISQYGPFYIDMGVGNYYGVNYGSYVTWLDLYNMDVNKIAMTYTNKNKVLGAEVTLWSQLSNQYTHHQKIWIRSSSLAERTWTTKNHQAKPDFFRRITAHQRLMHRRGIPTAGATCQKCETYPEYC